MKGKLESQARTEVMVHVKMDDEMPTLATLWTPDLEYGSE